MGEAKGRYRLPVTLLSVAGLIALWSALALLNGDPQVLPGPWRVLPLMGSEIASNELPVHLLATLKRVALAFVLSMIVGIAIGFVLGRRDRLDQWFARSSRMSDRSTNRSKLRNRWFSGTKASTENS